MKRIWLSSVAILIACMALDKLTPYWWASSALAVTFLLASIYSVRRMNLPSGPR